MSRTPRSRLRGASTTLCEQLGPRSNALSVPSGTFKDESPLEVCQLADNDNSIHHMMNVDDPDAAVARLPRQSAACACPHALLSGGRTRAQSTQLAVVAEVTPSTASVHLQRLKAQRLVKVFAQGKHRYYSLDRPEVAAALEALNVVASGTPGFIPNTPHGLRGARTCYDHIGGLAGRIAAKTVSLSSGGFQQVPAHTERVSSRRRTIRVRSVRHRHRRHARLAPGSAFACLDWSERRPHLGGALGAAVLHLWLRKRWVEQDLDSRILRVSPGGRRELLATDSKSRFHRTGTRASAATGRSDARQMTCAVAATRAASFTEGARPFLVNTIAKESLPSVAGRSFCSDAPRRNPLQPVVFRPLFLLRRHVQPIHLPREAEGDPDRRAQEAIVLEVAAFALVLVHEGVEVPQVTPQPHATVQRVHHAAADVEGQVVLLDVVLVARAFDPGVDHAEPGSAVGTPLRPLAAKGRHHVAHEAPGVGIEIYARCTGARPGLQLLGTRSTFSSLKK